MAAPSATQASESLQPFNDRHSDRLSITRLVRAAQKFETSQFWCRLSPFEWGVFNRCNAGVFKDCSRTSVPCPKAPLQVRVGAFKRNIDLLNDYCPFNWSIKDGVIK